MTALLFIFVLNLLESIFASEDAKTAILRSLLVAGSILAGVLIGAITSVVIAIIIAVIAFIFCISLFFSGHIPSNDKNNGKEAINRYDLIEGHEIITGRKSFDGLTFYGDNGKTYGRESTSSEDWYEK